MAARRQMWVGAFLAATACAALEPLEVDVELRGHDSQRMVVDLVVQAEGELSLAAEHDTDPGVKASPMEFEEGEVGLRVRGLMPDDAHSLTVQVSNTLGGVGQAHVEFSSHAALPGFLDFFDVTAPDESTLDPAYRLFDLTEYITSRPVMMNCGRPSLIWVRFH